MWKVMYDVNINRIIYNLTNYFNAFRRSSKGRCSFPETKPGEIHKNVECVVFNTYKNTPGSEREKHKAAVSSAIVYLESLMP